MLVAVPDRRSDFEAVADSVLLAVPLEDLEGKKVSEPLAESVLVLRAEKLPVALGVAVGMNDFVATAEAVTVEEVVLLAVPVPDTEVRKDFDPVEESVEEEDAVSLLLLEAVPVADRLKNVTVDDPVPLEVAVPLFETVPVAVAVSFADAVPARRRARASWGRGAEGREAGCPLSAA